jgi:TolB-like protein
MLYRFAGFELDLAAGELRAEGNTRSLEPQVFALLALLVDNSDRLVSKEEIVEKVWDGRPISDAAISSRIKAARAALGDDGRTQRFIKTLHRKGFRFVAAVETQPRFTVAPRPHSQASVETLVQQPDHLTQPSLAVLPFRVLGDTKHSAAIASALPDELISELAKLRWLFVTARGSAFRIGAASSGFAAIGQTLGVRYCLSGSVELSRGALSIVVHLMDALDESVIWADRFHGRIDDVHMMREQIYGQVLTALDVRIPVREAARARLLAPEALDAWSAYHLGLQHVYRFNRRDNAIAEQLFERALALDRGFARAYAGLSFVHFQSSFMRYSNDVQAATLQARRFAETGLQYDPFDPFINFTMGRSYWLDGNLDAGIGWLERAAEICPNYAQALYALAWTQTIAGHPAEGRPRVDLAMRLSPIDPLYYAMLATRALTHLTKGEDAEAADWAERGARSPGAHVLIAMIAAGIQAIQGNNTRAEIWAANVKERSPTLTHKGFFHAFPIKHSPTRERFDDALKRLGF